MDRRGFLGTVLIGGVSIVAAKRTWPFRIYSFPSEVVVPKVEEGTLNLDWIWVKEEIPSLYEFTGMEEYISSFEDTGGICTTYIPRRRIELT
jgi:hypothetical protein